MLPALRKPGSGLLVTVSLGSTAQILSAQMHLRVVLAHSVLMNEHYSEPFLSSRLAGRPPQDGHGT
jgi:hypothetical protein